MVGKKDRLKFKLSKKTQRQPDQYCTICLNQLDANTCITGEHKPNEGAYSICAYCGDLAVYGEGLILRRPTPAEILEVPPEMWALVRRVKANPFKAKVLPIN